MTRTDCSRHGDRARGKRPPTRTLDLCNGLDVTACSQLMLGSWRVVPMGVGPQIGVLLTRWRAPAFLADGQGAVTTMARNSLVEWNTFLSFAQDSI
jgi:hypothetical protein